MFRSNFEIVEVFRPFKTTIPHTFNISIVMFKFTLLDTFFTIDIDLIKNIYFNDFENDRNHFNHFRITHK